MAMEKMWKLISTDFLNYTLKNHAQDFSDENYFPRNKKIKHLDFEAQLLGNGLLFLNPTGYQSNNWLILSAGIHGNETAPMELLQQWAKDLFSGALELQLPLLLLIGNPTATVNSERFIDENLNRLFVANLPGGVVNLEQHRSQEIIQQCLSLQQKYHFENTMHFDLHTAIRKSRHEKFLALPYLEGANSKKLIQFWSDCGLTAALRSVSPANTFSFFSQSRLNAVSATVELGKVNPFGQNDLQRLVEVDQGIRKFISGGGWPESTHSQPLELFQVKTEIIKSSDSFKLNVEDEVANFSHFETGFILAQDASRDIEYRINSANEVLIFPNANVPIGQRAGLIAELHS